MESVYVKNFVPYAAIREVAVGGRIEPNPACLNVDLELALARRAGSIQRRVFDHLDGKTRPGLDVIDELLNSLT
jgi:hypothetical protein